MDSTVSSKRKVMSPVKEENKITILVDVLPFKFDIKEQPN